MESYLETIRAFCSILGLLSWSRDLSEVLIILTHKHSSNNSDNSHLTHA